MELLYLLPGAGMPNEELIHRKKTANLIAKTGTKVSVMEVGEGPISIESSIEEHMAIGPMLKKLLEIRKEGKYDAIIIGCAGDPGLTPARELLDIPVIGPAESSYHFACMLSDRFSIVSILHAGVASEDGTRTRLREMGLEARLASVEFVTVSVADMWGKNRDVVTKQMSNSAELAKQKGAGAIVLGCMSMAFLLLDNLITQNVGIPIVNPLKTAIKTAEMFVELGAKHSRVTYPAANFDKLNQTVFV
ncbi:MAG: aspartate/glutamate racemase family protein [Candidatus Heimdallarchaeota archaeon]